MRAIADYPRSRGAFSAPDASMRRYFTSVRREGRLQRCPEPLPGRHATRDGRPPVDRGEELPVALRPRVGEGGNHLEEPSAQLWAVALAPEPGVAPDELVDNRSGLGGCRVDSR